MIDALGAGPALAQLRALYVRFGAKTAGCRARSASTPRIAFFNAAFGIVFMAVLAQCSVDRAVHRPDARIVSRHFPDHG